MNDGTVCAFMCYYKFTIEKIISSNICCRKQNLPASSSMLFNALVLISSTVESATMLSFMCKDPNHVRCIQVVDSALNAVKPRNKAFVKMYKQCFIFSIMNFQKLCFFHAQAKLCGHAYYGHPYPCVLQGVLGHHESARGNLPVGNCWDAIPCLTYNHLDLHPLDGSHKMHPHIKS